jgi:hypothetical protein
MTRLKGDWGGKLAREQGEGSVEEMGEEGEGEGRGDGGWMMLKVSVMEE